MSNQATSSSSFYVVIDGVAHAVFSEVSGLSIETEVEEYAEGGNNSFVHRLPGRTRVGNITLKRGLTSGNEFYKWYVDVATGRNIQRKNISLVMYAIDGAEVLRWNFLAAYPVRWTGPQFDAASNAVAFETIELAHAGLQLG